MAGHIEITPVHWVGFIVVVVLLLLLDLGVFHRKAHEITFKEAFGWTIFWFTLSMFFAGALYKLRGRESGLEFVTGYVIELSLSMDNVFVIALIFNFFKVPLKYQHRVLFWGILGALVMRGAMIWGGVELIDRFDWVMYILGFFLVASGAKMLLGDEEEVHPEKNPVVRWAKKVFPVSAEFDGQKFFTMLRGRKALTPLALVLLMVETTDLIFAVDSIPAIFAVTQKPFIIFTSNVCAILGLRSLYFVLAGALCYFRHLKTGLSVVLMFIGLKMLVVFFDLEIKTGVSLAIVAGIIGISIVASLLHVWWDKAHGKMKGTKCE